MTEQRTLEDFHSKQMILSAIENALESRENEPPTRTVWGRIYSFVGYPTEKDGVVTALNILLKSCQSKDVTYAQASEKLYEHLQSYQSSMLKTENSHIRTLLQELSENFDE